MNKFGKKLSIIFIMAFAIMIGCFSNAWAADDGVVGIANLNNTAENSAKIGYQLLKPETGWKRYDDRDPSVTYGGDWKQYSYNSDSPYNPDSEVWKGTVTETGIEDAGESFCFNFYGSKLRILAYNWTNRTTDNEITIDGNIVEHYTENNKNITQSWSKPILLYEKVGLDIGVHTVKVVSKAKGYMTLDAIDIDSTGELKPYNEKTSTIVSNLALNRSTDKLQVGQTDMLAAIVTPDNATNKNVIWKSSDESIATVDSTGKITAVKEGKATITATTTDGSNLNASCTVNVTSQGTTPTNPTQPNDNTGNAILTITMTNGNIKSYTVPMSKVIDFTNWYDNRVSGSAAKAYYTFDKTDSSQTSFSKKTEYLIFDKISSYEVDEYTK